MKKRVAIIGAGPAGLFTAKSCFEYGLEPTIFEKSSAMGGVWSGLGSGAAWAGMHTNLSKWSCMFSDFPWDESVQDFPFQGEVASYLKSYADAFHVTPCIQFESEVRAVNQVNRHWVVNVNGMMHEFDGVIVASGFFAEGVTPEIEGQNNFNGRIIHSSKARPDMILPDDKLIVCGGSFSGYELASEFAKVSKHPVAHIFREPSWILNRYISNDKGAKTPVDFAFYSRKEQPPMSLIEKRSATIAFFKAAFGNPGQHHADLTVDENPHNPNFVAFSEEYISQVNDGKIIPIRGEIERYNVDTISLNSQKDIYAHSVVWATGFRASLPFLSDDIKSKIDYRPDDQFMPVLLHEAVWLQDIEGLGFVGFYRGPYFGIMELQARWIAGVFAGDIPHPTASEIEQGVSEAQKIRQMTPRLQFPYPDYVQFADRLASKVGCYPKLDKSDKLWPQVNEGVFLPCHYRLMGDHSNRGIVEQILGQIPYIK